jgi:ParB family chromosome partitioning protein
MNKRDQPYGRQIRTFDTVFSETTPEPASEANSAPASQTLPLSSIRLPAHQPRRYFDPQKLEQLVRSIQEHGVLEPLLVRSLGKSQYELVAGERRYRAAKALKLKEIPVVVRELSNEEALEIALVENLQREDLNPIEETEGILQLLSLRLKTPVSEVSSRLYRMQKEAKGKTAHNVVGYSETQAVASVFEALGLLNWESFVNHRLPLLNLPEEILEALRQGKIEYTKAQAIARVKDTEQRKLLLKEAIAKKLSLADIKERIAQLKADLANNPSPSLKNRADQAYKQLKRSSVWDDPKKRKQIEKLITLLEALTTEANS